MIGVDTAPGSGHVDTSTVHGPLGAAFVLGAFAGPPTLAVGDARPVVDSVDAVEGFDALVDVIVVEVSELEHATTHVPAIPASNITVRHVNSPGPPRRRRG
ncbi:MAG: hypothetical protein ABIR68_00885 [Ilumatobacteraceae bacterium]